MGNAQLAQFAQSMDVIAAFTQAMREHGIETEAFIQADGQFRRCRVIGDKAGSSSGWYVLHLDGVPAGAFGCWKRGISESWCAKSASTMTDIERQTLTARIEATKRDLDAETARVHAECKAKAERLWSEASETASTGHAYLSAKVVRGYGLRQLRDALLIPVCADTGELVGLQFIQPDSSKRFLTGTPKAGSYHRITGSMDRVLICEGYATGASLHEATGFAVAIVFDAGNLLAVAQAIRDKLADAVLVLCADDDRSNPTNPGMSKATAAALAVGGLLAVPAFPADAGGTDFNDTHQQQGIEAVRAAVEAAAVPCVQHEAAAPDHIADANNMASDAAGGEWPARAAQESASINAELRELGLDAALAETKRDLDAGRVYRESVTDHIKRLSVGLTQPKFSSKYGE